MLVPRSSDQPLSASTRGSFTLSSIRAGRLNELPGDEKRAVQRRDQRLAAALPGTMVTLRCPTLLSLGTSRHSSIDSAPVKLSTLLGSPAVEATISTQSCP